MSTHCTLSCIIRLHLKGPDIQVKKTADSQSQRLKFTNIQNGQAKKPVEQSLTVKDCKPVDYSQAELVVNIRKIMRYISHDSSKLNCQYTQTRNVLT